MKADILKQLEELNEYSHIYSEENEKLLSEIYEIESQVKKLKTSKIVEFKINYKEQLIWDSQLAHFIFVTGDAQFVAKSLSYQDKQKVLKNIPNVLKLIKEEYQKQIKIHKQEQASYESYMPKSIIENAVQFLNKDVNINEQKRKPGRKKGNRSKQVEQQFKGLE